MVEAGSPSSLMTASWEVAIKRSIIVFALWGNTSWIIYNQSYFNWCYTQHINIAHVPPGI